MQTCQFAFKCMTVNFITMQLILRLILVCLFAKLSFSACPRSCSGHGLCGIANICSCFTGWNGGASDCSVRSCPTGVSWADKAYSTDVAHQVVECSGGGTCDRSTGTCICYEGYSGNACQRTSCAVACNGHGTCGTLDDVSLFDGPDYNALNTFTGDGLGTLYLGWDETKVMVCECDYGYGGANCADTFCPHGDDPDTVDQNYLQLVMTVTNPYGNTLYGTLGLEFQGSVSYFSLTNPSITNCISALQASLSYGYVGCVYTYTSATQMSFTITIYSWPQTPRFNNMHTHMGIPGLDSWYCDASQAAVGTSCYFMYVTTDEIREYLPCSDRGECDMTNGLCTCKEGYGGPACGNYTYMYSEGSNALPGMQINVNNPAYTSSAIQIMTAKPSAPDFYFIEAVAASQQLFYVRGDGVLFAKRLITEENGQTIASGGLYVTTGGVTIMNNALNIYSPTIATPVANLESTYAGATSGYTAVTFTTMSLYPGSHYIFSAINVGTTRFAVRGDGATFIYSGGLSVTGGTAIYGGATVYTGGLQLSGGATIMSGGLKVTQGGLYMQAGGATFNSGGLRVNSGGLYIGGGGLQVTGGATINGGLTFTTFSVSNTLAVGGAATVTGATVLSSTLSVVNAATFASTLSVGNAAIAGSTLSVVQGATMGSTLNVVQGATMGSTLSVAKAVTLASTLSVGMASTFATSLTVATAMTASGSILQAATLSVGGATTIIGTLSSSTLSVGSTITIPNAGTITASSLSVQTTLTAVTLTATTLSVSQQVTMASTLSVANAVTLAGSLTVGMWLTVNSGTGVTTASALSVGNAVTVTGSLSVNSVVTLGAATNLMSSLSVAGTSTFVAAVAMSNTLSVAGSMTANAISSTTTLSVAQGATLASTLSVGNAMTVTGSLSVASSMTVGGSLSVVGTLYQTAGTVSTSDRRLKTNIAPVDSALSKISGLRGIYYTWKQDLDADTTRTMALDTKRHIGLFAQDVEAVLPESVAPVGNGTYLGVDYSSLIPLLVEGIRELDTRESEARRVRTAASALDPVLPVAPIKSASHVGDVSDAGFSPEVWTRKIQSLEEQVLGLEAGNQKLQAENEKLRESYEDLRSRLQFIENLVVNKSKN